MICLSNIVQYNKTIFEYFQILFLLPEEKKISGKFQQHVFVQKNGGRKSLQALRYFYKRFL